MKIGISTACFYPHPPEEALDKIASLGLHAIEIFFNTESEFQEPFRSELARRMRQNQLSLISVHPFTSLMEGILLFSEYERRTADGLAQYRRYFAAARSLGARYLTLHGERLVPGLTDSPATLERKLEHYHQLCRVAAEEGIVVAQENVAWCRSSDPKYLKMLYQNIPELRYTLDIKQAHRARHSWKEYLDVIGPRLVNVHINDFDDTHSCLLPGEGILDYNELFCALHDVEYDNPVLIEVYSSNYKSEEQISASAGFLRNAAQAAGYLMDSGR